MAYYYNKDTIMSFYASRRCTGFLMLNESRIPEIESSAALNHEFMAQYTSSLGELMTRCAEVLTTSAQDFGLANGDEVIFFFIKTVDPDFLFLEAYESARKKEDVKPLCLHNLAIYDPYLIYYESLFQRRFKPASLQDLWTRGKIDTSLLNKHGITK